MSLEQLNQVQREAVKFMDAPQLVFAGAGSGKTRVITMKIAHLIEEHGIRPWEILALTFTNKAAREMRERVQKLIEFDAEGLWIGTFHATCLRLLRRYIEELPWPSGFVIYDDSDQEKMVAQTMRDLGLDTKRFSPRGFKHFINSAKHHARGPLDPELQSDEPLNAKMRQVYRQYEEKMVTAGAMDFGDLIFQLLRLIQQNEIIRYELQNRWRYVLVDEFQDTNVVQYLLVKALAAHQNICVVGDDDQSIYRWRGASIENIYRFERDFENTGVFKLEQNYRSTQTILDAANAVISKNPQRADKKLWTNNPKGLRIRYERTLTERHEAEFVANQIAKLKAASNYPLSEVAIFYRTNAQSRVFEDAFRGRNMPYVVVGGYRFYERAEVKDAMAYLRVAVNPKDDVNLRRIVNTPTRGIGKTTMDRVAHLAAMRSLCLFDAMKVMCDDSTVNKRARTAMAKFVKLIDELKQRVSDFNAQEMVELIMERIDYVDFLTRDGSIEGQTRAENIQELLNACAEYVAMSKDRSAAGFLDQIALVADIDQLDEAQETVTLMTIHSSKGLEFGTVFLVGMEQGLFPHFNSKEPAELQEERRLCYVAITRARERLFISNSRSRRRFNGPPNVNPPSPFLSDIPRELLDTAEFTNRFPGQHQRVARVESMRLSEPPRAGRSRSGNEVVIDFSDSQLPPDEQGNPFSPGTRVYHPKFGSGTVQHCSGVGPFSRVTVRFPDFGVKKIVAKYLQSM